ncbi:hypothetical protein [Miltoncostaea marina]|uniref:hypothetical protein n=1 Tax=Miltoncostaea marina TaxID=2843215 RepID=UPI001C3CBE73|nr:hypothetical protein [Miltoncostaea marina]
MKGMTVADFIRVLEQYPPNLEVGIDGWPGIAPPVLRQCFSEDRGARVLDCILVEHPGPTEVQLDGAAELDRMLEQGSRRSLRRLRLV